MSNYHNPHNNQPSDDQPDAKSTQLASNEVTRVNPTPKAYRQQAQEQIEAWKHPKDSWWQQAMSGVFTPVDKASTALINTPQVGEAIKQSIEKMIVTLNDAANWGLDEQHICADYQKQGFAVTQLSDIQHLSLADVDEQVRLLKSRYVALTSAQGIGTGMLGWAAIAADVVALLAANLRAISEYAAHYGFDINNEAEKLYAMSLLALAASASAERREHLLNQSQRVLQSAEQAMFNQVNKEVASRLVRQTATSVATNLVRSKAAQVVPALGAVVAGGVNADYTASVCEAAYQCYRERFLQVQAADTL